MALETTSSDRMVLINAVRGLTASARSARALLAVGAPDYDFYLGVEAAAAEVLHPESITARPPAWLDRESRFFREGYLATSADLAGLSASGHVPMALHLPRRAIE